MNKRFSYFKMVVCLPMILAVVSCENNYNKMVRWSEQILVGTHIDTVKANIPNGVVVNWQRAEAVDDEVYYEMYAKNNYDILGMQNFLAFDDDRFVSRRVRK